MISPLFISAAAVLITFIIAAVQDVKSRSVYSVTWYPAAVIGIICAVIYWVTVLPSDVPVLILSIVFAGIMAVFALLGFFGKADAKALILLSLTVPVTPFAVSLFPSLAVSSVINAGVLVLLFSLVCLIYNLIRKNRAPFHLMCSGIPVRGADVLKHHGFIAEDVTETEGGVVRTYLKPGAAVSSLKMQSPLMIKVLREHSDTYADKLSLYAKCDKLWIVLGIPFLLPLTIGFIFALFGVSAIDIVLSQIL